MILGWEMTRAYHCAKPLWGSMSLQWISAGLLMPTGLSTSSSFIKRPQSDVSFRAESNLIAAHSERSEPSWGTLRKLIHSRHCHINEIFDVYPYHI